MQYDTKFQVATIKPIYRIWTHPIRSSNARCGELPGVLLDCLLQKRMILPPLALSRTLSLSLTHSHTPSLTMPPMLCLFSQNAKEEVYCGIITTHLVISERLAKDGLSMQ